jgi:hypothetical protein
MGLATILTDPAIHAWDEGGNNGLDEVLARAFGIEGGYQEFNGIMLMVGFNIYIQAGGANSPMHLVVANVRQLITANGTQRVTLETIYGGLPGCGELRSWIEKLVPDLLDLVPLSKFMADRPAYEQDRLNRRVGGIRRDLGHIASELTIGPADKQLAREIVARLDELEGFKSVHDILHHLKMEVLVELQQLVAEDILPAEREVSLQLQLEEMALAVANIRQQFTGQTATSASLALRDRVIKQLSDIISLLSRMAATEAATAATGARLLRGLLRQQMSIFDSELVSTSERIPFLQFAARIRALPSLSPVSVAAWENPVLIDNVANALADVSARLIARQSVHRLWQQVDATILAVEELLGGGGSAQELILHWQDIASLMKSIANFPAEPDPLRLIVSPGLQSVAQETLTDINDPQFRGAFNVFTRFARVRFQAADSALLADCGVLKQLNNPLEALL